MLTQKSNFEALKQQMQQEQVAYFDKLQKSVNPVNFTLADRYSTTIEQKIRIKSGNLQFEENKNNRSKLNEDQSIHKQAHDVQRERQQLFNKLKSINNELGNLKNQRIQNPFTSNSPQPAQKLLMLEQGFQRQVKAQNFISSLNLRESHFKSNFSKRMQDERQRIEKKEAELLEFQNEEKLNLQRIKHDRIRNHLREIKLKNQTRLNDMMNFEENYFKELDQKLDNLRLNRLHLKDQQMDHITIQTGQKNMKVIKETKSLLNLNQSRDSDHHTEISRILQVEKPLYQRMRTQYKNQVNKTNQENQEEFDTIKKQNNIYKETDLDEHQHLYNEKKVQLKQKYEKKRTDILLNLGVLDGKITEMNKFHFESRQNQQTKLNESLLKEKKDKRNNQLKILNYMEMVKNDFGVHISEKLQMEALIRTDKLKDNKKYITILKGKRSQSVKMVDREIYLKVKKRRRNKLLDESIFRKEFNDRGNLYLSQLPDTINTIKKETKFKQDQISGIKKSMKNFIKSTQSARLLRSEIPNYLEENEVKYHLVEKIKEKGDWQMILETKSQPIIAKSLAKSQVISPTKEIPYLQGIDGIKFEQGEKVKKHNLHIKLLKEKNSHENKRIITDLEKIQDVTSILKLRADQMEKVAKSKWTYQPLDALDDQNTIDDIRINIIQARLKVLDLQNTSLLVK